MPDGWGTGLLLGVPEDGIARPAAPPHFPLRTEVFLFLSVPWEASLPTVTQ